jgi:integrase
MNARPTGTETGAPSPSTPDGIRLGPDQFVELVVDNLARNRGLAPASLARLTDLQQRFARFLSHGPGLRAMEEVSARHVRAFVEARGQDGQRVSVATMHLRRSAVRLLFEEARRMGLIDEDPVRDLSLPPRSSLQTRPLTDDEIALCRSFSLRSLTDTKWPAAWALAEAGVRCRELPRILVRDLDLASGTLRVRAGGRTPSRITTLTSWGLPVLKQHLRSTPTTETPILPFRSSTPASAFALAHRLIAGTLKRSGLGDEPDVTPASVATWRGASELAGGTRIEEIARMLGYRSLDRSAEAIGFRWRDEGEA